ncbi:hypothetical protein Q5P01_008117 [Channa striata]|uniref:Uncharacterized protein n=1 Tax=Channa striata TaxID=64152 RepID=A0AA88N9P5_CHASR|nr:hypothetical protein Q5P01_008117 [Channa striata]
MVSCPSADSLPVVHLTGNQEEILTDKSRADVLQQNTGLPHVLLTTSLAFGVLSLRGVLKQLGADSGL